MRCSQLFRLSGHVNLTGKIGKEHNYWSECIGLADSEAGSDIRCVGRSFRGINIAEKANRMRDMELNSPGTVKVPERIRPAFAAKLVPVWGLWGLPLTPGRTRRRHRASRRFGRRTVPSTSSSFRPTKSSRSRVRPLRPDAATAARGEGERAIGSWAIRVDAAPFPAAFPRHRPFHGRASYP